LDDIVVVVVMRPLDQIDDEAALPLNRAGLKSRADATERLSARAREAAS
jgi:hypothetical protein